MSNSFNYNYPIFRELQTLEAGLIRIEIHSDYNTFFAQQSCIYKKKK